jgi:beta-lactamase superfamily II metal-dependent hydrolase
MRIQLASAVLLAATVAACIDPPTAPDDNGGDPADGKEDGVVPGTTMSWKRVSTVKNVPKTAPTAGHYRVHLIDLGTGLGILIQGADFTMLYDGGSGDDRAGITRVGPKIQNGNRLLAYLFAALGPSGPMECAPDGDNWTRENRPKIVLDHVFLSHPHEDHDSLLDDVVRCYDVHEVWDSGDNNNREGYANFMAQVAATSTVTYHNAAGLKPRQRLNIFKTAITLPMDTVAMAEDDDIPLGAGASFELLHVDGQLTQDENLNSTVVRVELRKTVMLLAGDEEAGARLPPSSNAGQIEGALLANKASRLKADIYQVAHHGSSTSNRTAFLDEVAPKIALLGAGPLPYSGVVLPEQPVLDAIKSLPSHPVLLRTDLHDATVATCVAGGDRIGNDDARAGGCDNYVISVR